jgi:6-pyruvoyltetrahydropterin/6-carboxytetrahydropterin synthase
MVHRVTKTYGHELGLSATFRQWRARSHCRFIHGYALGFKLVFEADRLDENGWVKDFGGLKPLKNRLIDTFDHQFLVAADDPHRERLEALMPYTMGTIVPQGAGEPVPTRMYTSGDQDQLAQIRIVPAVGCEAFARMVWNWAWDLVTPEEADRGVRLVEVECREHAGNAASYMGENN